MMVIKSVEEVEVLRKSSLLVSKTLAEIAKHIKPGVSGLELDKIAEDFLKDHGASPSFKGYNGFPNALCISVNDEVVHGIPNDKAFQEGDVVSVDCGAYMNGFHGDQAFSFALAGATQEVVKLLRVTRRSLELGVEKATSSGRVGDIGYAVQNFCERQHGYGVVRELVGHGLGSSIHEEPEIPNFGRKGYGRRLLNGLVIAIEPMINLGSRRVRLAEDGWTIKTADGKPSAHFEHDVAVGPQADVLTTFELVDEAIAKNENVIEVPSWDGEEK